MRRVETIFGLYCDELKIHEAEVLADVSSTKVEVLHVMIPWRLPTGQTVYLDAREMLTISTMGELKDYLRGAYGAQDANLPWDEGPDVA